MRKIKNIIIAWKIKLEWKKKLATRFLLRSYFNKKMLRYYESSSHHKSRIYPTKMLLRWLIPSVSQSLLIHSFSCKSVLFFSSRMVVFKCEAAGYNGCLFRNWLISSKKRIISNYADDGNVIRSGDTNTASRSRLNLMLLRCKYENKQSFRPRRRQFFHDIDSSRRFAPCAASLFITPLKCFTNKTNDQSPGATTVWRLKISRVTSW